MLGTVKKFHQEMRDSLNRESAVGPCELGFGVCVYTKTRIGYMHKNLNIIQCNRDGLTEEGARLLAYTSSVRILIDCVLS